MISKYKVFIKQHKRIYDVDNVYFGLRGRPDAIWGEAINRGAGSKHMLFDIDDGDILLNCIGKERELKKIDGVEVKLNKGGYDE